MTVVIERVEAGARHVLENLMQLYVYDWSELGRDGGSAAPPVKYAEVGDDGRYAAYPLDAYFDEPRKHPFVFRVARTLVGFALVAQQTLLTGIDGFDMAEFFVMRRHRRCGVGNAAARLLFERFPGRWQVRQRRGNDIATTFWRRAIGDFTNGRFDESMRDDERWRGPVQSFSTVASTAEASS